MRPRAVLVAAALAFTVAACDSGPDTTRYDVTIGFNDSVTQDGIDEVTAFILAYDGDADVRVLELQPPILQADVETSREDLCEGIFGLLARRDDVANADCEQAS